jgi:hypothetical protein
MCDTCIEVACMSKVMIMAKVESLIEVLSEYHGVLSRMEREGERKSEKVMIKVNCTPFSLYVYFSSPKQ